MFDWPVYGDGTNLAAELHLWKHENIPLKIIHFRSRLIEERKISISVSWIVWEINNFIFQKCTEPPYKRQYLLRRCNTTT